MGKLSKWEKVYRELNRRFDKRTRFLISIGWLYDVTSNCWTPPDYWRKNRRSYCLEASFVMHASRFFWNDRLKSVLHSGLYYHTGKIGQLP